MSVDKAFPVEVILFDIGGVLVLDPMETVLFTPKEGLVDKLNLDRKRVEQVMKIAYKKFSFVEKSLESSFWQELGTLLSVKIPLDLVSQIDETFVRSNPQANDVLDFVQQIGLKIGVISNNTSFWYAKEAALIKLDRYLDPDLVYLSHTFGVSKSNGLFDCVAERVTPRKTLVIDDRLNNAQIAHKKGFNVILYSMNTAPSGLLYTVKAWLG